jgi:pSer/pThr/pTyr-binding forkhead associated (FHA) protein/ribosomal protein L40E
MIVCPNCNHLNPDGAIQCEACYTPLPVLSTCPNCGASVQADASFCGQCGFNLQGAVPPAASASPDPGVPDLSPIEPLIPPDPLMFPVEAETVASEAEVPNATIPDVALPAPSIPPISMESPASPVAQIIEPIASEPLAAAPLPDPSVAPVSPPPGAQPTQLQTQTARLLQVQTNLTLELPANLSVIHIGKPNDRIPPDIDVSGFPNSEIVSRVHADIRVEADAYYIEDLGSSNGTYINNVPLPPGNRHRLRIGDRIALGKGDKVTFLFQA